MKMKKTFLTVLAMVFVASGVAFGQTYAWKSEDASNPILIRSLLSQTVTGSVNAASIILVNVTDSAASLTVTLTPTKTVADVVTEINAATNASGAKAYQAVCWEAVSTDTVSNKLLSATISLADRIYDTDIKWDTSSYLSYTVIPDVLVGSAPVGGYGISRILGNPGGTGNVTVNVYEDDTLLYQRVETSPVYVSPQIISGTNDTTNTAVAVVSLNLDLGNLRINSGKRGLIKVTRATTGTTGGVGGTTAR
jgi:hypothetical protein